MQEDKALSKPIHSIEHTHISLNMIEIYFFTTIINEQESIKETKEANKQRTELHFFQDWIIFMLAKQCLQSI